MTEQPTDPLKADYQREVADSSGFIPITKDHPLWQALDKSINFIAECYDPGTGGFTESPGSKPTIQATRMGLQSLWWAAEGLDITDAISRFKSIRGVNTFEKTSQFISSRYHPRVEIKNGNQIEVGGFFDTNDAINDLRTPMTQEGLEALFSLERMVGLTGTVARFEQEHPQAFSRILNHVENRWVQLDHQRGAYTQGAKFPLPDIWGIHSALEIITLSTAHRFETDPEETRRQVMAIKQRTAQIFNYLRSVEYPSGGFGFIPGSNLPNVMTLSHVTDIVNRLFFFNQPDKIDDLEAKKAFLEAYNFTSSVDGIVDNVYAMWDPKSGGFAGYPLRPVERRQPEKRSRGGIFKLGKQLLRRI